MARSSQPSESAGAAIALDGQLSGSGRDRGRAGRNVPLEITQTLKGRIDKLETMNLDQAKTTIVNAGRTLADLDASGRYQLAAGQGSFTVKMVCPEALLTARTLGWFGEGPLTVQKPGRLEANEEVTLGGKGKPAAIKGDGHL